MTLFTTPLSVTGTAEDLDAELSTTIISFVGSHLQMKNTLEKAKAEMDAASKAAQAEARAKSKTPAKTAPPNTEVTQYAPHRQARRTSEARAPEARKPLRYAGTGGHNHGGTLAESDETDSFARFAEIDDDEESEESEELDDVA